MLRLAVVFLAVSFLSVALGEKPVFDSLAGS
jgi:hypothetical protein